MRDLNLEHTMLAIAAFASVPLDIKFYFPPPGNQGSVRYAAWDCYAVPMGGDTPNRYGGKANYLDNNPLSFALAKQQLLMGIAGVVRCCFMSQNRSKKTTALAEMLDNISYYMAEEIATVLYGA